MRKEGGKQKTQALRDKANAEKYMCFRYFSSANSASEAQTAGQAGRKKTRNFGEIIKAVMDKQHPKQIPKIIQSILKDTSKLPLLLLTQKQELELIKNSISKLQDETNLKIKINLTEKSKEQKAKNATPHKPAIILE